MLIFTTDKSRLQRHFEKDNVLFSYHLGDLDEFYFNNCQWSVDYADRARVEECVLIYTGCEIPSVLAFGLSDRFQSLLEKMIPLLPPKFYCHFQNKYRSLFKQMYSEKALGTHHKMKLELFKKYDAPNHSENIKRLSSINSAEIQSLYARAYPDNYFTERMLETKKYFGYFENDKLVAVTGVHVDSNEYKIAALGNIVTDQDYRGKGIATALTSRLLEELVAENKTVCLNVKADNQAAIASYTKLGFIKVHEYEEALFELK